jgi:hypothetical protein
LRVCLGRRMVAASPSFSETGAARSLLGLGSFWWREDCSAAARSEPSSSSEGGAWRRGCCFVAALPWVSFGEASSAEASLGGIHLLVKRALLMVVAREAEEDGKPCSSRNWKLSKRGTRECRTSSTSLTAGGQPRESGRLAPAHVGKRGRSERLITVVSRNHHQPCKCVKSLIDGKGDGVSPISTISTSVLVRSCLPEPSAAVDAADR